MSDIQNGELKRKIRRTTLKHLQGSHNQKRHGWRYGGGLVAARNAMRGQPKSERDEYRKRAGMAEPKKVERQSETTPMAKTGIEKRMDFDQASERAKIFTPNGLLQPGKTRTDARGFQRILEVVRNAAGTDWSTAKGVTIRDYVNHLVQRGFKPKRLDGEIQLVNSSGQAIKPVKQNKKIADDYINFLFERGEFSTVKEFSDFDEIDETELRKLRIAAKINGFWINRR